MSHTHSHSHDGHSHGHHTPPQSFNAAFAIAISITLAYALSEAGYAFYANSMSLLADAVHNLGDSVGLILAWIANWLMTLPARQRYSYGFKRTSILAALANAFLLVGTSAIIGYESVHKLFNLTEVNETIIIVVGLIGILVNAGTSLLFMRGAHDDMNIKGAFMHLMADALILVGVVISAIIIRYTNAIWLDPVVSLIIITIILWGTWGLLRDSVGLMLDAIPRNINHAAVKDYLAQYPGVKTVHDFHIWGLSTREVALTAHLEMPEKQLTDEDYQTINHTLQHDFHIHHVTLQVETGHHEDPCGQKGTC